MKVYLYFMLCFLAMHTLADEPKPDLVLGTNVLIDHSSDINAMVQGGSVEHVKCILDKMQVHYQIRSMPWRRARQDVRSNNIDGFFTAVAIDEASDYAKFSAPLVLENWYWFWRSDLTAPPSWKEHFQIGAILGSQQEAILAAEGYSKTNSVNNLEQLVKLLFSNRIDVVLADKEQFESAAKKLDVVPRSFKSRFFRYMPLGVYFGDSFLTGHAGFLEKFNNHISACSSQGFEILKDEQQSIRKIITPLLEKLRNNPLLIDAVIQQNSAYKNKADVQLFNIDEQWQKAFKLNDLDFPQKIVNQTASRFLLSFEQQKKGLITEIILMDERGYNVAISNMTSDYWQGDEDKYLLAFKKPADWLHFGFIKYDESSRRFQVQVSASVSNPQTQQSIGVITLGVDIEKALSQTN